MMRNDLIAILGEAHRSNKRRRNLPSGFAVEEDPCSSDAALLGDARPELDECGPEEVFDVNPRPNCSATSAWSC